MHPIELDHMALARFFGAACIASFGTSLVTDHADAQGANTAVQTQSRTPSFSAPPPLPDRAPVMPPPVFNPSNPYAVPQSRETPVSPASPGSVFQSTPSPGVN